MAPLPSVPYSKLPISAKPCSEEIKVAAKGQSYLNEKVPGFPLEYDINNAGFKMVLTVTEIEQKIKKADAELTIQLQKTADSLAWAGSIKAEHQLLIGFAMETQDLLKNAEKKLRSKNADYIVANSIATKNSGFASDSNQTILLSLGDIQLNQKKNSNQTLQSKAFSGLKESIAIEMLEAIFSDS